MTWNDYIAIAAEKLADSGVDEPKTNAEYLAMHARGMKTRAELRSQISSRIEYKHAVAFSELILRRMCREPLQYILREWEFYGLPINLSPSVLIPRPETEILVEQALSEATRFQKRLFVMDIGTGSGAIALALGSNIPMATIWGVDSSASALLVAKRNRKRLSLKNVFFHHGDVLSKDWTTPQKKKFDLIVCNPPYVSKKEFKKLEPEIQFFEPREALTDGSTGLTFYTQIATITPPILREDGCIIFEIGYGMEQKVTEILTSARLEIEKVIADLAGISRVIVARISKKQV